MSRIKYNSQRIIEEKIDRNRGRRYCGSEVLKCLTRTTWQTVKQISYVTGCSVSTVRQHLNRFIELDIVRSKRAHDGNLILMYRINEE